MWVENSGCGSRDLPQMSQKPPAALERPGTFLVHVDLGRVFFFLRCRASDETLTVVFWFPGVQGTR